MRYQKAIIYHLSGTGNSFRVAMWLHETCADQGIDSKLIPLNMAKPRDHIDASHKTLVAMAYPTHGLMPPWSAIKFIVRMPFMRRTHFIALPTRGCFHIGPVPIPGAAGLASFLPFIILPFKGYSVRGAVSFDMPINMTSLHPKITDGGIMRIIGRAKRKADRNFGKLLSGKRRIITPNNLWEILWAVIPLAFFPLYPVVYLLIGRFFMGKMMFASYKCTGCGTCAESCSCGAIVMKGMEKPRPYWRYNCEDCLRCMNFCPHNAVEAGHSWAAVLSLVSSFPLSAMLFDALAPALPWINGYRSWFVLETVNFLYYFPAILIAYFIFFHLIRLKPINALFTWTTLTHFYKRYREPGTKLKDMLRRSG